MWERERSVAILAQVPGCAHPGAAGSLGLSARGLPLPVLEAGGGAALRCLATGRHLWRSGCVWANTCASRPAWSSCSLAPPRPSRSLRRHAPPRGLCWLLPFLRVLTAAAQVLAWRSWRRLRRSLPPLRRSWLPFNVGQDKNSVLLASVVAFRVLLVARRRCSWEGKRVHILELPLAPCPQGWRTERGASARCASSPTRSAATWRLRRCSAGMPT